MGQSSFQRLVLALFCFRLSYKNKKIKNKTLFCDCDYEEDESIDDDDDDSESEDDEELSSENMDSQGNGVTNEPEEVFIKLLDQELLRVVSHRDL